MSDSKRLAILKGLQTQLETITIANGYHRDVAKVSRKFRLWEDVIEVPRINILPLLERIEGTVHRQPPSVNISNPFGFRLVSYVDAGEDVNDEGILADEAENHISDVKKCLYANPTLGLSYIIEFSLDFVDAYFIWNEQKCVVVVEGHLGLQWSGDEP